MSSFAGGTTASGTNPSTTTSKKRVRDTSKRKQDEAGELAQSIQVMLKEVLNTERGCVAESTGVCMDMEHDASGIVDEVDRSALDSHLGAAVLRFKTKKQAEKQPAWMGF